MGNINISNTGGSIDVDAIEWTEDYTNNVATQEVSMRPEGEIINNEIWFIEPTILKFTIRLSNTEYNILNSIYQSKTTVTIIASRDDTEETWTYVGVFEEEPLMYELSSNGTTDRIWKSELVFKIESISYG